MTPARFLPLTTKRFLILLALAEGVQHGYGIRRTVEDRTGGRVHLAAGTLYEAVPKLISDGLVEEVEAPSGAAGEATSRWRFYRLTPLGRDVVRAETERLESAVAWARNALTEEGRP